MKTIRKNTVIGHSHGIHIRVAKEIVQASQRFACEICIYKTSDPENPINAKAILDLMTAGIESGQEVELVCSGEDAEKAVEVIEFILSSNFDRPN